jgi:hypothetical protein
VRRTRLARDVLHDRDGAFADERDPEPSRRAVREEVHARLSEFEADGRLVMSVEMLIAAGRA